MIQLLFDRGSFGGGVGPQASHLLLDLFVQLFGCIISPRDSLVHARIPFACQASQLGIVLAQSQLHGSALQGMRLGQGGFEFG